MRANEEVEKCVDVHIMIDNISVLHGNLSITHVDIYVMYLPVNCVHPFVSVMRHVDVYCDCSQGVERGYRSRQR